MKKYLKVSGIAAAAVMVLATGAAQAESKYGYKADASTQVSATASLTVAITVPKLLLLRIGTSGAAIQTAAMTASLSGGIPGGVAAPANSGAGGTATGWDGSAPSWNDATSNTINTFAWTNSSGGGQIVSTVTTPFADAALAGKVDVASTTISGAGLTHPVTLVAGTINFAKTTVASSDWVFSVTGANLATTDAGALTQTMLYTASTL